MNYLKVACFQYMRLVFQSSKSQKKVFQKTVLNLKFKFPANNTLLLLAGNLNFKLRIVFWNIFFLRFEKQITPLGLLEETKKSLEGRGIIL